MIPAQHPTGPLLTRQDVADLLAVSERYVKRLTEERQIVSVRLGRRTTRYTRASVEALIEDRAIDVEGLER